MEKTVNVDQHEVNSKETTVYFKCYAVNTKL